MLLHDARRPPARRTGLRRRSTARTASAGTRRIEEGRAALDPPCGCGGPGRSSCRRRSRRCTRRPVQEAVDWARSRSCTARWAAPPVPRRRAEPRGRDGVRRGPGGGPGRARTAAGRPASSLPALPRRARRPAAAAPATATAHGRPTTGRSRLDRRRRARGAATAVQCALTGVRRLGTRSTVLTLAHTSLQLMALTVFPPGGGESSATSRDAA